MIIGRDIMNELGLILNFKDHVVRTIRKGPAFLDEAKEVYDNAAKPEALLPQHLKGNLATDYLAFLTAYLTMYDDTWDACNLKPTSYLCIPNHTQLHAVKNKKVKDKIQQLINDYVLEQIYDSEMASPAFFLVKSDGSLRILVDFRWLNKYLRRVC
ncbi:Pol protein [Phytophthora palmivora]|uniref:Pol protein n=1 Tax=Phytophthora palmivora TaxID=4796 RepID=A0A2P4XGD8_9STRA|nr:Pol protein [Phytophthora palmivora]